MPVMATPLTRRSFGLLLAGAGVDPGTAGYWRVRRRGANWFNHVPTTAWLDAAASKSIRLVRLAPDKWKGAQRDFLIGDADRFDTIPAADLELLIRYLDEAHRRGIDIVLTMLSLPGLRWRQQNGNRDDLRLWTDPRFRGPCCRFWSQLASALKGHPAIAGFDLLNEPHPERTLGVDDFRGEAFRTAQERMRGTPADLNAFNREVHAAIRAVDAAVPVILEAGLYATPWAVPFLTPVADPNTLYSFHMYEPYDYTTRRLNHGRPYPGKAAVAGFLDPVIEWQKQHGLGPDRIFAAEFGCSRTVPGAANYLEDCVSLFEQQGWHWAFYSFREDEWTEMDYELGTRPLSAAYWAAKESEREALLKRHDEPLFSIFLRRLQSQ
jgi:endoglucanase